MKKGDFEAEVSHTSLQDQSSNDDQLSSLTYPQKISLAYHDKLLQRYLKLLSVYALLKLLSRNLGHYMRITLRRSFLILRQHPGCLQSYQFVKC
jgi:hypothetical protein